MHPWQQAVVGCGLMLHAPLCVSVDPEPLQREYAALDAAAGDEARLFLASDGSWSSITLIDRGRLGPQGYEDGVPTPALEAMPSARALLEGLDCRILGCFVHRQPPGGFLRWHFDQQALHLDEGRLIVPVHAPPGAVTRLGDGVAAYPDGVLWAGDFTFPHQVENDTAAERIVLLVDVTSDDRSRRLAPADLSGHADRRIALSEIAVETWRRHA